MRKAPDFSMRSPGAPDSRSPVGAYPCCFAISRTMCCCRRLTAIFSSQPLKHRQPLSFGLAAAALEAADARARDEAVAVHAHEAVRIFLLETRERILDEVFALGGAHGHVFQLGLEVDHVVDGDEMDAPALLRRKKRGRALAHLAQRFHARARGRTARARALPSAARCVWASAGSRSRALRTRGSRRRRRRW